MDILINSWKKTREFATFSAILNGALTCRVASYFFMPGGLDDPTLIMLNLLGTATSVGFTTLSVRSIIRDGRKIYLARNLDALLDMLQTEKKGTRKYEFALDLYNELLANGAQSISPVAA